MVGGQKYEHPVVTLTVTHTGKLAKTQKNRAFGHITMEGKIFVLLLIVLVVKDAIILQLCYGEDQRVFVFLRIP